jgi:glycosyltransferase involved in cell wall biosynthesis
MTQRTISVMHLVDTLRVGGVERVAVNLANLLPRAGYRTHLCTTRAEGPFAALLSPAVGRLALARRGRFDLAPFGRLTRYIREQEIRILHAHGSTLFLARLAALVPPYPAVIWHDHYGRYAFNDRPAWLYRGATQRIAGVIAVNHPLVHWSTRVLHIPEERVWYIPNLVEMAPSAANAPALPGRPGKRIVCLANLRPQKDHFNLLAAMHLVRAEDPESHLLLAGDFSDARYKDSVLRRIHELDLARNVSYLGRCEDVASLLDASDVAVLSSLSEGLPVSLLEYGLAGLPAVATEVGQCGEVLAGGAAGLLVPAAAPEALASALLRLLGAPAERARLGQRLRERVASHYGADSILVQIGEVYERVLTRNYAAVPRAQVTECAS